MRLEALNLNLLVALNALLIERSVTGAARSTGVSQPAMSRSLKQLRELFEDPLLVKGQDGLVATERASKLAAPLANILAEIARVIGTGGEEEIRTTTRLFRIALPDYLQGLLGPEIMRLAAQEAPACSIMMLDVQRRDYAAQLENGQVDLVVHACFDDSPGIQKEGVLLDRFACAVRKDHPLAKKKKKPTLKQFVAYPHCLISISDTTSPGSVDIALAEEGLTRHVACRLRSYLAAPKIVASTDCILTAPERLLRECSSDVALHLFEPPVRLHSFEYDIVWHERFEADPKHRWLRDIVARASALHEPHPHGTRWQDHWGDVESQRRREIWRIAGAAL